MSVLFRIARALTLALLATALSCCSYLPPTLFAPDPSDLRDFEGLLNLADRAPIRILFIHGMGGQGACDVAPLLKHLAERLKAPLPPPPETGAQWCGGLPPPKLEYIHVANADSPAELYRYDLDDGRVTFMFLYWARLTQLPKQSVAEPSIGSDASEYRDPDSILVHRSLLASFIKEFEQNALGDVLLYSGTYQNVIRPAVEKALCRFVDGKTDDVHPTRCDKIPSSKATTAVITHSLGGYLFMDALKDICDSERCGWARSERHDAATQVWSSLDQIFMLANQIKMLNLTRRLSEKGEPQFTREFLEMWNGARVRAAKAPLGERKTQLLAISDPNDILSWELNLGDFHHRQFKFANIYLGTTGEFFGFGATPVIGVAASPYAAHLNYLTDPNVMDIIACGMKGSEIVRCAP